MEIRQLEDLCEVFVDGNWIETKDQAPGGIRLIQTGNVGNGEFKDRGEKARFISEATFKRLRCTEIFEGDCLISRLPDPVGRSCLLPSTGQRMITAVDCTIVRFKCELIEPKYFNYFSQSLSYINQVSKLTTGATRERISRSNLGKIAVPRPQVLDQQRIVAVLDDVFARLACATANVERNLKSVRELFDNYLNSVFAQKGEGWVEAAFEECLDDIKYTRKIKRRDFLTEGDFPIVSQEAEFINGYWSKQEDVFRLTRPVVIFGDHTKILKYVDFDFVLGADGVKILQPNVRFDPKFFYYVLKNLPLAPKGYARHYSLLKATTVSYPEQLETQNAIAGKLDAFKAECDQLEEIYRKRLAILIDLKQSILERAFSGELTTPSFPAVKEAAE